MLEVSGKFVMFEGNATSMQELEKFKNNFELLQTFLGAIEQLLLEKPKSTKIQSIVDKLNQTVDELKKEKNVEFSVVVPPAPAKPAEK